VQASKDGLDIATGLGILRIKQLQLPGKKAMSFADVFNARQDLFLPGNLLP
jgi:methionyl-tRNA formyltransferase